MTKIVIHVVVFDPIKISIGLAHQNDLQKLSFVKAEKWPEILLKRPTPSFVTFVSDKTLWKLHNHYYSQTAMIFTRSMIPIFKISCEIFVGSKKFRCDFRFQNGIGPFLHCAALVEVYKIFSYAVLHDFNHNSWPNENKNLTNLAVHTHLLSKS